MMKKNKTPLSLAIFAAVFMFSTSAKAFLPLPVIDVSSFVNYIKQMIEQVKSSTAVVTTTQTVAKISGAIGEAKNAIAQVKQGIDDNVKEFKKVEEQALEYKKQYDTYKEYTEDKIEKAKEMKENAERLKELMEDPSALTGTLQDKFTSVAKSYGDEFGVPTSAEEFDALKEGAESKFNQGKELVDNGTTAIGKKDVLPQTGMNAEDEDEEGSIIREKNEKNIEKDSLQLKDEQKVLPDLQDGNKFRRGFDDQGVKGIGTATEKLGQANKTVGGEVKLNAVDGVKNELKSGNLAMPVKEGAVKSKTDVPAVRDLKNNVTAKEQSLSSVKEQPVKAQSLSSVKEQPLKAQSLPSVKEQPEIEKKPAQGFRKSAPVNSMPLRKESFFNRYSYDWSFAAMESDHSKLKTGKATSGDAIIPESVAEFCELSVSELKTDYEKILSCLADITEGQKKVDTSKPQATVEDITNMRMQNAAEALAISMKMENIGAHENEVIEDLDEKASTLSEGRNLSGMMPTYNMEIAKVIKNYAFVRATRLAYDIFDDIRELDYTDYEK